MNHLSSVKHVIIILSGKGGVGKSTMAVQITLGLHAAGKKVGLLDVDLCGPSIPKMFNLEGRDIHQCPEGWLPVYVDKEQKIGVMSIGFLLSDLDDAVVWRGPKKNAMIKQFLSDVYWQDVDYLIIDTPPGTSDEHITVMEALRAYNPDGAILVTTPQAVAVGDVRRELTFCRKTHIPVVGIVENMSGYVCPHCSECTNIFSKGGGQSLAEQNNVPFLGSIPIDRHLTMSLDTGKNFLEENPGSPAVEAISHMVTRLIAIDKDLP
ncbi:cytosolic Fe-S cluster assembly factor NUBP2 homolog [Aplysia californica]|uniref:Cytosolic Fe-S cluster assembly factor NUBP2 homolog n=1 Tax=Aplysia californica TaxID=6500 RepID=A0ABM1VYP5_APLCA|nr:cytosolic Fe-S cluster assembly factor NUBP2 homolog [Aplysia californica]XP_005105585.1 cytosolic Fe-S cluster assembly factor NUBP2 homolog [Aplysia californica]XP_035827538.1 cytosolic Fe-S cluster assembly factor NUBP2 homolog [Aplysia californica]